MGHKSIETIFISNKQKKYQNSSSWEKIKLPEMKFTVEKSKFDNYLIAIPLEKYIAKEKHESYLLGKVETYDNRNDSDERQDLKRILEYYKECKKLKLSDEQILDMIFAQKSITKA